MKRINLLFVVAALLFACNSKKTGNQDDGRPVITVSILPQKTFVEKISGDDFKINVLIPPGASPAAYTLLPSQLKEIARSEVWFRIGYIGFEQSWQEKIKQANKEMRVVDLSEGLNLIYGEEEQHGDHVHVGGVDPHIWMSPSLVKQMAKRILNVLAELRPENSDKYQANYMEFVKEIDQLDIKIRNELKEFRGSEFITFHPSLSYFAREYGLVQHSLETGGKEPTPQHLREVVDLAKENGINVIYIQTEFDRDHARVFAEEIDGEIIEIRPLDPQWAENLMEITHIFVDNFK
ncbi:MAG TPA: zinc ABC transporter substrate-binding protein [Tangfeifania sp.]|nr:zinc ABC transporter substrate-binding protein [Tangfeifania sp.]